MASRHPQRVQARRCEERERLGSPAVRVDDLSFLNVLPQLVDAAEGTYRKARGAGAPGERGISGGDDLLDMASDPQRASQGQKSLLTAAKRSGGVYVNDRK